MCGGFCLLVCLGGVWNLSVVFQDSWRKPQVRKGDLQASAEMSEKADKCFVPARFDGRTMATQQQCEREGRLVSRQTIVFALEDEIPADEVEKGRSGELLKERFENHEGRT